MKDMESFLRIAEAKLMTKFPFTPQRKAIAARMYVKWLRKKRNERQRT
jgi:hypothetical protein